MTKNKTYPSINTIEWGPVIGGVATGLDGGPSTHSPAYAAVYKAFEGVRMGDLVAVRIPGMGEFVTEFTRNGPWIKVGGRQVALSDRCNGWNGDPGQMWTARLAIKTRTRAEAVSALPEGTLFFLDPPSDPSRDVHLRTDTGAHNLSRGTNWMVAALGNQPADEGFPYVIGKRTKEVQ